MPDRAHTCRRLTPGRASLAERDGEQERALWNLPPCSDSSGRSQRQLQMGSAGWAARSARAPSYYQVSWRYLCPTRDQWLPVSCACRLQGELGVGSSCPAIAGCAHEYRIGSEARDALMSAPCSVAIRSWVALCQVGASTKDLYVLLQQLLQLLRFAPPSLAAADSQHNQSLRPLTLSLLCCPDWPLLLSSDTYLNVSQA